MAVETRRLAPIPDEVELVPVLHLGSPLHSDASITDQIERHADRGRQMVSIASA